MSATASVYDAIIGGLTLRQVLSCDYTPNVQAVYGRYSGGVDPQQVSVLSGDFRAQLESADLGGCFAVVSPQAGLAIASPGSILLPYNSRAPGGTFAGDLANVIAGGTLGLLVPRSVSAQQDDAKGATVTLEFFFASADGATVPVSFNANQSLSAQAFNALWSLGPVVLNDTPIGGLKGSEVQFGITVPDPNRYGGLPFNGIEGLNITERQPMASATFQDVVTAGGFGNYGEIDEAVVYYRARAAGGTHWANASGVHVAFTLTGGLYKLRSINAQGQTNASHVLELCPLSVAVSVSSTIPNGL